jgi:hypothetical protein
VKTAELMHTSIYTCSTHKMVALAVPSACGQVRKWES